MRMTALIATALLGAALGCGDAPPPDAQQVIDGWKKAGIDVIGFDKVEEHSFGEADCRSTELDAVETILCTYETDEAAAKGRAAGLESVGAHTGAALTRGKVLLVVADRNNKDPEGRTINKITRTFLGK